MTTRKVDYNDVKSLVGQELGVSDWHLVTQEEINAFAECTHDHQWIHLDVERAKKESPFGGPVARFPSPVPVGKKVRARATLNNVEDVTGGLQVAVGLTFEVEDGSKPACVAEGVYRFYA